MGEAMLKTTLLLSVESTVNRLLESDPVTTASLGKLEGASIEIHIEDIRQSVFILPFHGGLQLHSELGYDADVTLTGDSGNLLQMISSENKASFLFGNGVSVSGKHAIANQFQTVLANMQIDWEAIVAEHTGDMVAHQLVSFLQGQATQAKKVAKSFELNFSEYIQEEAQLLPTTVEADIQFEEIETLRERTDRLAARLDLIDKKTRTLPKS